jgi:hypothetical protein
MVVVVGMKGKMHSCHTIVDHAVEGLNAWDVGSSNGSVVGVF